MAKKTSSKSKNKDTVKVDEPEEKINPTDKRILKLETRLAAVELEKQHLMLQNKQLKRKSAIFEAIVEELEAVCVPLDPSPSVFVKHTDSDNMYTAESVVMHLSDEHMDEIILPEQVQGLEEYNFPIAVRRAENYVDRVLELTQNRLCTYRFNDLWILAYGDHTNGEIHNGVERSYYRNQFKNCFAIGQVHSLMIRDLAPHFERVHVVYVPGNHGRTTTKKDFNTPHDSWDYMVGETARMLCGNIENVDFVIPNSYSINVNIEGHVFVVQHGDDVKSWNSLPWYGLERQSRRLAALNASQGIKAEYFCYGHFHQSSMLAGIGNGETLINGAWKGCDPYSLANYGSYTEPNQLLHGVHPEQGVTWRFKVKLKSEDEKFGPKRYMIK